MRALLRKDVIWLVFLGVAGLAIGLMAMGSQGATLWYRPEDNYGKGSLVFLWIAGGVLGLCAGLFEDATFTREYLLHRPVSAARLFWTRQLGCGLAMVSWIAVVPALHLAGSLLFDKDSGLVEAGRYWYMLNQGAVAFAFYAVALLAATLVRRWLLAIIVATAMSTALVSFYGLILYTEYATLLFHRLQALISIAIAVPLLLVALRISREGRDLDHPVSRARLTAAACALALLSLAGSALLHIVQLEGRRDIVAHYPKMARQPDGTPVLVRTRGQAQWRVDDHHRRIAGAVDKAEYAFEGRMEKPLLLEPRSLTERGQLMRGVKYRQLTCSYPNRCYFGSDGRLHLYVYDGSDDPTQVKHVGKADGTTFSPRAQTLGYWGPTALIADPQDGGIWRYQLLGDGASFTRLALPDDDRFVEDLSGLLHLPRRADLVWVSELVVRGERGVYVAERDAFRPAPPEVRAAVAELDRRRSRPQPQVSVMGPVHFQVTLPASAGEPAFEHFYAPHTFEEYVVYVPMQGLSLLRAPVLTLASLLAPPTKTLGNPTDNDARILLDPLVMLGSRWALALTLLVAGVLATLTFRRLGRLGVPASRRAFWTALVAGSGLLGFIVYRACENQRAWHTLDLTQARPPLVIRSAA